MRGGRLPLPIRRSLMWLAFNIGSQRGTYVGTFAIAELASLGADSPTPLSIWTAALTYGLLDSEGSIDVRLTVDHRVLDGAISARVLARLEDTLNGPIAQELRDS
jgi:pyruvate/2-oxoglutarate dehydrogenase complex dihydrolipoamide acyltransferase (E2) component